MPQAYSPTGLIKVMAAAIAGNSIPAPNYKAELCQFFVDQATGMVYLFVNNEWLSLSLTGAGTQVALEYTAPPANPVLLVSPAGQGTIVRLGDDAGGTFLQIQNESGTLVALIDSLGGASFNTSVSAATFLSAGTQLRVKGGLVTDFIGTTSLSTGEATVLNTNIAAGDHIFLSYQGSSLANSGQLSYEINAGVSFVIHSTNASDANDVSYFIVRQV